MGRNFTITTPLETVKVRADGRGEMAFTVTNTGGVPDRGMARIVPLGETRAEWLSISGESDREFPTQASHQFTVNGTFPPGTTASRYTYRLDILSARRTGEERVEGPVVGFEVPATSTGKKGVPWWVWVAAALLLLTIVGVGVWLMNRPPDDTPPEMVNARNVIGSFVVDGIIALQQLGFAIDLAAEQGRARTPGLITGQTPVDQPVPKGSTVRLTVAQAAGVDLSLSAADRTQLSAETSQRLRNAFTAPPQLVAVPPVERRELLDALVALERIGLEASIDVITGARARAGVVLSQDPEAGRQVERGTRVELKVGARGRLDIPRVDLERLSRTNQNAVERALLEIANVNRDTVGRDHRRPQ